MARTKRKARDAIQAKRALKKQKEAEEQKEQNICELYDNICELYDKAVVSTSTVSVKSEQSTQEATQIKEEPIVHPFVRSMWETLRHQTVYLCSAPSTPAQDNLRAALQAACQEVQNLHVE